MVSISQGLVQAVESLQAVALLAEMAPKKKETARSIVKETH
jgi:hypothetical protein